MFKEIKESVDLMEAISKYTKMEWIPVGSSNFELEDKVCPFPDCGHKDCFRLKKEDDEYFYKCFSCDEAGSDAAKFYSVYKNVDLYVAARKVAKDYGISTERTLTTSQKILELAANFYHNNLIEDVSHFEVGGTIYTPLSYQREKRGHSMEVIRREMVGYVGTGLFQYLATFDFSDKELIESGLFSISAKTKSIQAVFFNPGVYIYPQFLKGMVSHFTTKDPHKVIPPYQLKNEFRQHGILFYGQEGFAKAEQIILVEGENDRLTLLPRIEANQAVLATNGSISKAQVDWLGKNLGDRLLITIFDNDDAGEKYRTKFWRGPFPKLQQLGAPDPYSDVDEFLNADPANTIGGLLAISNPDRAELDDAEVADDCDIFLSKGCYFKMKTTAEGGQMPVRVTNFTIKLKNIFIKDGARNREIVLTRNDGVTATCPYLSSAIKVSLKSFREFAADAIDGNFYGSESDLTSIWDFVYKKGSERVVHMPKEMGDLDNGKGWLFNDAFIQSDGGVIVPDSEEIMWVHGNTIGYKPAGNQEGASEQDENPWHALRIRGSTDLSRVDRQDLLVGYVNNLAKNLGSMEAALTMIAWANANAYSKKLFEAYGFFPFLFMWGRHAKGKTTLIKWVMATYGMQDIGYAALPNLGTGVGFSRNMSVFSSVPMCLDEVRADQQTKNFYGHFRAWYNRQGRTLGVKGNQTKVHTQEVRSTLILGGQDVLTDAATRSRCIEVQIPTNNREMQESYVWMEQRVDDFRWIGFDWIQEAAGVEVGPLLESLRAHEKEIVADVHCDSRIAKHWAMISFFGQRIAAKCNIDIDFLKYAKQACAQSVVDQEEEDVLMRFFSTVEGMQVEEHCVLTNDHIALEGDSLVLWMTELIRLVKQKGGSLMNEGERFSKNAILKMLQDEPYFVETKRSYMGPRKAQRRAYILKGNLPAPLENIKKIASTW